ncbi:hypothetical protein Bca52824_053910 [Brassica carinata]|uniref:Uncharacterized protein n=1 Tax=Brassica carinata TaxID=52824 RepID=A0A8X7UK13_BRACI|nr:hypothetical protein Bca52824_053910 [Brassica carinata]
MAWTCFQWPSSMTMREWRIHQGQLLDAIDEHTFFLKRLNSQMNMKLLLGLERAWELYACVKPKWVKRKSLGAI